MSFAVGNTLAANARLWHLVDARGQVLGHLARGIASTLTGELKPVYTPHRIPSSIFPLNPWKDCNNINKWTNKWVVVSRGYWGSRSVDKCASYRHFRRQVALENVLFTQRIPGWNEDCQPGWTHETQTWRGNYYSSVPTLRSSQYVLNKQM